MIQSILDQDYYKFLMGQFVHLGQKDGLVFNDVDVEYKFINRGSTVFDGGFPEGFGAALESEIVKTSVALECEHSDLDFLHKQGCFKDEYLDFLFNFFWNPKHIKIKQLGKELSITIKGPWRETIYYEVPLMAMISELYSSWPGVCDFVDLGKIHTAAKTKAAVLSWNKIDFSEFGTRRRFSHLVHETALNGMVSQTSDMKTSNAYFAKKYNIPVVGTIAHETIMAMAALFGYEKANEYVLNCWKEMYGENFSTALTDTFTSGIFFSQFSPENAAFYKNLRQDSGHPYKFAQKAIEFYINHDIDPKTKRIIFSDSLSVDKCLAISDDWKDKINCSFGIGTNFTADVEGYKPLNMVIKMTSCNGKSTVKLSDVEGKVTGDAAEIENAKRVLGV